MRYVFAILAFVLVVLVQSCAGSQTTQEARVASAVAIVANTGLDVLGKAYEHELTTAILVAANGKYATIDERNAAIDAAEKSVVDQWLPVWGDPPDALEGRVGLWPLFAAAHAAWAIAIEAGLDGAEPRSQMEQAYCALLRALPRGAASTIRISVLTCDGDKVLPSAPASGVLSMKPVDAGTDSGNGVADAGVNQ